MFFCLSNSSFDSRGHKLVARVLLLKLSLSGQYFSLIESSFARRASVIVYPMIPWLWPSPLSRLMLMVFYFEWQMISERLVNSVDPYAITWRSCKHCFSSFGFRSIYSLILSSISCLLCFMSFNLKILTLWEAYRSTIFTNSVMNFKTNKGVATVSAILIVAPIPPN